MKKLSRKQIVATAILVFGVAAAGLTAAYAATEPGKGNPMSGLVSAIAQKFNLNEAEVQKVFDAQRAKMETEREANRAQMESQRQQNLNDRLAKAVTDGKLTQTQADAIKAKNSEMQAWRETQKTALEGKTGQERKTAMESQRQANKTKMEELKAWAQSNNIPNEYLPMCGMGMQGRGMGRGGHGGMK